MKSYYIILRSDGYISVDNMPQQHETMSAAKTEAEKLALKHPNRIFIILRAIMTVCPSSIRFEYFDDTNEGS